MKSAFNTILEAYNEAFISIIPYVMLMTSVILLAHLLLILNIDGALINKESLQFATVVLHEFFYFVLLISIAYQLARRYAVSQTQVIFQSIAVFITSEVLLHKQSGLDVVLASKSPFMALITPFLVVKAIDCFMPVKTTYQHISTELNTSFLHIYRGIIIFFLLVGVMVFVSEFLRAAFASVAPEIEMSNEALFLFRTLLNHLFWFVGLHGTHLYNALFGVDILSEYAFPGLTWKHFYEIFVVYGGAGATLSLIIAVFIASKDQHSRRIAKLALPFGVFNINEVLIYGLPIIFNRKLILPFILTPLVNTCLAYACIAAFDIKMTGIDVSWITPAFVNAYIISQGNLAAVVLQVLLLTLGVVIYMPFVRRYSLTQSFSHQSARLSAGLNVPILLKGNQGLESQKEQQSIIRNNEKVDEIIALLKTTTLLVYYQPKVNIRQGVCRQFEALLRIRMPDGEVKGPFFLPPLEKAGLEPIIDLWVCQQVNTHLRAWQTTPLPEISINLHPDTLARSDVIEQIIAIHQGNPVGFEVIERGLLDNASSLGNIKKLKASGFKILIDDFGAGAASMENLYHIAVDTLKIDKSLADLILTQKGRLICKNIVALCQDMKFDCVIEGVESEAQMQAAARLGIPLIQGFYFSPAIAKTEAETFAGKSAARFTYLKTSDRT